MTDDGRQNVTDIGQPTTNDGQRTDPGAIRHPSSVVRHRSSDIMIATACGVIVAFRVVMAYATVPLYSRLCRSTRFVAAPQVARVAPGQILRRNPTVRLDAEV